MLRRSLFLLFAFALLGLGLTALYALLQLRGPADLIAEARLCLQRGELTRTVNLLDQCEPFPDMRDPELQRQLWRTRLEANRRLPNIPRALDDVERLLADGETDRALQLDRIYFLAVLGLGEQSKQRALEFLAANPQSARGLELAGEACKVEYALRLRKVNEQLRGDLDYSKAADATTAMLAYLYRPADDPGSAAGLESLRQLYDREARHQQAWPALQQSLRELRDRIQQALGYFQQSLELAGRSPEDKKLFFAAAFRSASFALQQGGRSDDRVALAELYLQRFDHRFTVEAAIDAAATHLRDGLELAAIEVVDRYLPPGSQRKRIAANKLDRSIEDLLLVKAKALYRLQDQKELDRFASDIRDMATAGLEVPIASSMVHGFWFLLANHQRDAELHFTGAYHHLLRQPRPVTGDDLLETVVPVRLQLMRNRGAKDAELTEVIQAWQKARPGALEPLRERVRTMSDAGQWAAAMATAGDILLQNPRDEQGLQLLALAAERSFGESGQDSEGLLLRCLERKSIRPEVPHPVCYLLCGEAAMKAHHFAVARECGRLAADSFPAARWPRHLHARALLELDAVADAVAELDRAIVADPDDRQALALWLDSCRRLGEPVARHLRATVAAGVQDRAVATELLRSALQANPATAAALARKAIARKDADAELLALAAHALAANLEPAAARPLLDRCHQLLGQKPTMATKMALADATLAWLVAAARTTADDPLAALARIERQRITLAGPTAAAALLATAATLEQQGRPRTAYDLAADALAMRDAAEQRDAHSFLLAGRLAMQLSLHSLAASHFTAALSFDGSDAAAEPLARLLLLQDQPDRALQALALTRTPADPALALRLQGREAGFALAQKAVLADASDLLAQVVFALTAQVAPDALGADLAAADATVHHLTAEIAALLADTGTAPLALPRAEELAAAMPESPAARLLLARALGAAGQGDRAAALHAECFAQGCRAPALFAEPAHCQFAKGYVQPEPIRMELRAKVVSAPESLAPHLQVLVLRDMAGEAAVLGQTVTAATILARLWLQLPVESHASVADATLLLGAGRTKEALVLLDKLRTIGADADRVAASSALFVAAIDQSDALTAAVEAELVETAAKELERGRVRGPALMFLLADIRRLHGIERDTLRGWLEQVVLGAAAGDELASFGVKALAALQARHGRAAALAITERALDLHPEAMSLWVERARLLAEEGRARAGVTAAQSALLHTDQPGLLLELLAIAAEARTFDANARQSLGQLPPALLESPLGKYVRGLVALRQGRSSEAAALLAEAPPRPDGFPLFARTLTLLMRRDKSGLPVAAELLGKLLADYPSSSFAPIARSLARQLLPN